MDTYYTIEEKYLLAVDELNYGESPKGLQLLNEIISNDPLYARAHYQLGKIYYYTIQDYQTAGYHFKTCMELEPKFPDNYFHYLDLVVFLNMKKQVDNIVNRAMVTPGVNSALIYNLLGLFSEKNRDYAKALTTYKKALIEATCKDQRTMIKENIERLNSKIVLLKAYQYHLTG